MKKIHLLLWLSCVASLPAMAQQYLADTLYFRFDSYELDAAKLPAMKALVAGFKNYPYYVDVSGHTDAVGSDEYNQVLSDRRAKALAMYLIGLGLDKERVGYKGYSTKKPIGDNLTLEGRNENRRADVAIIHLGKAFDPNGGDRAAMDAIQFRIDSLRQSLTDAANAEQAYLDSLARVKYVADSIMAANRVDTLRVKPNEPVVIENERSTVLVGPNGTIFTIPKNAFNTKEKKVNIEIDEMYSRRGMMFSEVTTLNDNMPIETLGMVKLSANVMGTPVDMRPENPVTVTIPVPAESKVEGLKAFAARGGSESKERYWTQKGFEKTKKAKPTKIAVRNWLSSDMKIAYNPTKQAYEFALQKAGWVNVGVPLSQKDKTKEKKDFNIVAKMGGKVFESATVYVMGRNANAFIPLRLEKGKVFMADAIESLDQFNDLILIGVQYDAKTKQSYVAYREFDLAKVTKQVKDQKPVVMLKGKFKKVTDEEYEEQIDEISKM